MSQTFSTPTGDWKIQCDRNPKTNVQGWNQADRYLLEKLFELELQDKKLAIVNDMFGALSLALALLSAKRYSDSAIFRHWLHYNWSHNNLSHQAPSAHTIDELSQTDADVFLVKLPKNLHFFRYQLSLLSQHSQATVLVSGMQKYWPASFYQAANDFYDVVEVYPGVKKAKCMKLTQPKLVQEDALLELEIPEFNLQMCNYPNVFSREQLDIGTRFLLENFPDVSHCHQLLDLACGNGILGIYARQQQPELQVNFIDESAFALKSAEASSIRNGLSLQGLHFIHHDASHSLPLDNQDMVLCNPPFHQQHSVTDEIAIQMIKQAHACLRKGGQLYLVGNRHLPYQSVIKRFFGHVTIERQNSKFKIYQSIKI